MRAREDSECKQREQTVAALKVAAPQGETEGEGGGEERPFLLRSEPRERRGRSQEHAPHGDRGRTKKRDTRKFLGQRNLWTGVERRQRRFRRVRRLHSTEGK